MSTRPTPQSSSPESQPRRGPKSPPRRSAKAPSGRTPKAPLRRTQGERSEATRGELVAAGRRLFAERGYAGVGTEEIVRAAGVTRGALYHHFAGKPQLFEAVYEQVERELTEKIANAALGGSDPMAALRLGTEMFLDACLEPEVQRIALLDAPAVLGWERWREIAAEQGLGLVEAALGAAMEAGQIARQPLRPLAHVMMGALDEAAMLVARAEDTKRARAEVEEILNGILEGLARIESR
jgi:AcrR family transcriptional regulator